MLFFLSNFMILHARLMRVKLAQDLEQSTAGVRPGSSGTADFARFATRIDGNVREGEKYVFLAATGLHHRSVTQPSFHSRNTTGENSTKPVDIKRLSKHGLNFSLEWVRDFVTAQVENSYRILASETRFSQQNLHTCKIVIDSQSRWEVLLHKRRPHSQVVVFCARRCIRKGDWAGASAGRFTRSHSCFLFPKSKRAIRKCRR
mmetsp:Transcript_2482/g.5908  ORF Transcript_2482/g.5908 Transcript_2482/m.5908 type:complete len:203 (-) Transcript_2482:141-749(-)